jgi:signal transduction histidine kinase
MMNGLRARLFLSYLFLLVVTLGVIVAALIVILNTRPAPPEPTYQRLSATALNLPLRQVFEQTLSRRILPLNQRLNAAIESLTAVAEEYNVRILIINNRDRTFLFDSAGTFRAGDAFVGRIANSTIPSQLEQGVLIRFNAVVGNFLENQTEEWLFVGLETLGVGGQMDFVVVIASPRPMQSLQDALQDFGTELLPLFAQAGIGGLLVALILAVVITRSIAQPLQTVARAAAEVAEGKFDQQVPIKGPAEIRAVAEAFNRMSAEIRTEQMSQKDLLANVSHDLKTPLTSIQGYAQAIIDGAAPDPRRAARIIYDESARLNRMVVGLTDLARLQAGQLVMSHQPIDLGQLAGAIAQRLEVVAAEKQIALRIDTPSMPPIMGDGDRLAQVITNLISNAITYTPEQGTVHVSTQIRDGGVEMIVRDTGVGIPAEELPRIFERFYQVDKSRGPRRGTGLGLAIAQEIVQAHGGTISAASPGKGRGATFTVWLPSPQLGGTARRRISG